MAELSWPFDTAGVGLPVLEDQWSRMARNWQVSGVDGGLGSAVLAVSGNSTGMQVTIPVGEAEVRGHHYQNTTPIVLTGFASNGGGSNRIDRVVLKLDPSANSVVAAIHAGTVGAGPPALTQTDAGIYEMPLALVTIGPGVSTIRAQDVADDRRFGGLPIRPCLSVTALENVLPGTIAYEQSTGSFQKYDGSAWTGLTAEAAHAAVADVATRVNNIANSMQFRWEDIGGQPTYVWGSNGSDIARVWAVRNFTVAAADNATQAGNATNCTGGGTVDAFNVNAQHILSVLGFNVGFVGAGVIQAPQSIRDRVIAGRAVLVAGDATLGSASSSARYKTDIEPLDVDLDAARRIGPVSFRMDPTADRVADDVDTRLQDGFLAEDVAANYPRGALYDEQGRPDDVDDRALLAVAYLRLAALEDDNADLRRELTALRDLITSGKDAGNGA